MITASASWTDNERFLAEATSHHAIVVDAGSDKSANSPVELVLIGLCACTASDVVTILRKKREAFTRVEVSAEGERAQDPPMVYTEIRLRYRVSGRVSRKAVEDAVRLSKEKYCSVSAMLEKTAKITAEIELEGMGSPANE
ncbi:MAG TPA: OsmC family protein [Terriglobales bacterium]|nr:OsmC family protein [Terriglobales bacterium]